MVQTFGLMEFLVVYSLLGLTLKKHINSIEAVIHYKIVIEFENYSFYKS